MKFQPKSREELRDLLPEGEYQAVVSDAVEKQSKAGNEMIELKLSVWDQAGNQRSIVDRLIVMDSCMWKIHDFCESAGLMDEYKSGSLTAFACLDKNVHCKIVRKAQEGFDPKNEVKSYFIPNPKAEKKEPTGVRPQKREPIKDDSDVPF